MTTTRRTKIAEKDRVKEEVALLYCKWCPKDCQGLTREERIGCLAAGGFADEQFESIKELAVVDRSAIVPKSCRYALPDGWVKEVK